MRHTVRVLSFAAAAAFAILPLPEVEGRQTQPAGVPRLGVGPPGQPATGDTTEYEKETEQDRPAPLAVAVPSWDVHRDRTRAMGSWQLMLVALDDGR